MDQTFWERIGDRTVISYLGSYLLASWGIVQFVDFIVARYNYDPVWTDLLLLFLALILPGVIIFAFRQSSEGPKSKSGAYWLPGNILLAVVFIFLGFRGQLGAKSEQVTIKTEAGEEIVRLVPNQTNVKRIVLFPFNYEKDSPKWSLIGWPSLQALDIEQDNRIFVSAPLQLKEAIESYKYDLFDAIPYAVQQKVAEDLLSDYWITCSVSDSLHYKVYSSQDGKMVLEKALSKTDMFTEVDVFTATLSEFLFNRELFRRGEELIDLPSKELLSGNLKAFQRYFEGKIAANIVNDRAAGAQRFQKAIELDPNFALAHASYGTQLYYTGRAKESNVAYEKALELLAPLPERQQFNVKSRYYIFQQDAEKAILLLEMWRKLYPSDYRPYSRLFDYYSVTGRFEQANEIGDLAIKEGHGGPMFLRLAQLNMNLGQLDKASAYLEQFRGLFPEKAAKTKEVGELYQSQGKFKEAIDFFESLTILDPSDHKAYLSLANVQKTIGDFRDAERAVKTALKNANTIQDTIAAYDIWEGILEEQGKMKQSIEVMKERWSFMRRIYPELAVVTDLFNPKRIYRYASIGQAQIAKDIIIRGTEGIQNGQVDIQCVALINYFVAIEDGEALKAQLEKCSDDIIMTSGTIVIDYIESAGAKFRGDYEEAIEKVHRFIEAAGLGSSDMGNIMLADCYRLNGQLDEAQQLFEAVIAKVPGNAALKHLYALTLKAKGDKEGARREMEAALEIWKDADENFDAYLEVKETLAQL